MKADMRWILPVLLLFTILSCKKPFTPAVVSTPNSYLVVEGVLNAGTDSTILKLSTTTPLADTTKSYPLIGAAIYVEDANGNTHALTDQGNGLYKSANLGIQNTPQCKLHITAMGKQYVSDMVTVDHTPAIDSIPYKEVGTGLQFYVYTHDASNKTRYFRWNFDETYAYISNLNGSYKYQNGVISYRLNANDDIYHCYNTIGSNRIILASASDLTNTVINQQPITYVDVNTGKLARGYSMLLRQYALSKEAYEYWQQLKKNTEQLGSIFDAQPTGLKGNMHAVSDPNEPVLGFISASTVSSKRIFIDPHNLSLYSPAYFPPPTNDECSSSLILIAPLSSFDARLKSRLFKGDSLLYEAYAPPGSPILGYLIAPAECVDCRVKIKGATNVKPPYWPANLQ